MYLLKIVCKNSYHCLGTFIVKTYVNLYTTSQCRTDVKWTFKWGCLYIHVFGAKFVSYNCANILDPIIQFMSQVCSSRPVGGQVQGCVQAFIITYMIFIQAWLVDLFIDVVFVSRGFRFLFLYVYVLADFCVYSCTRLIYMFLLMYFLVYFLSRKHMQASLSFIQQSVLGQVQSLFQSELSIQCNLELPPSNESILSFP